MAQQPRPMTQWQYRHYCTHAELLASVRNDTWCDAQLEILDRLIDRLVIQYAEDSPASFDQQWFRDKAKQGFYRLHITTREDLHAIQEAGAVAPEVVAGERRRHRGG